MEEMVPIFLQFIIYYRKSDKHEKKIIVEIPVIKKSVQTMHECDKI